MGSCCGGGGATRRLNTANQSRLSTSTAPRRPGDLWTVTLPTGEVHSGMTEHEALMLTLTQGGGMEQQSATPT